MLHLKKKPDTGKPYRKFPTTLFTRYLPQHWLPVKNLCIKPHCILTSKTNHATLLHTSVTQQTKLDYVVRAIQLNRTRGDITDSAGDTHAAAVPSVVQCR